MSERSRGSKEFPAVPPSDQLTLRSEVSKATSTSNCTSPREMNVDHVSSTRPNLFVSYTAADLEHKEQALHVATKSERRRFASIRNSRAFEGSRSQIWKGMAQHPAFEVLFGIVVITNALFIGVDVQQSLGTTETPVEFRILQMLGTSKQSMCACMSSLSSRLSDHLHVLFQLEILRYSGKCRDERA